MVTNILSKLKSCMVTSTDTLTTLPQCSEPKMITTALTVPSSWIPFSLSTLSFESFPFGVLTKSEWTTDAMYSYLFDTHQIEILLFIDDTTLISRHDGKFFAHIGHNIDERLYSIKAIPPVIMSTNRESNQPITYVLLNAYH